MNYTQNETEKRKVEQYFSRKKINPEDIQSFCFMQNYKFRVGPSILILQLRSGKTKMLRPNKTGTEVLHYLLDKQIPFSNYTPQAKQAVTVPEKSYWSIWNILFDVFCVAVLLVLGYMMLKVFLEEPSSEYLAKDIAKYFALIIYMICFPIQETNWHDPQYDLLHERVELYAGEARAQLLALNDAVQYISVLAAKLRAL